MNLQQQPTNQSRRRSASPARGAKIMADTVFRVHPAIGIGRVGDSEELYIAPVTAAGTIEPGGLMGGLPIKPGTEDTPITAEDFRDKDGNPKRQAARFRVYAYPAGSSGKYPSGGGTLVTVGSVVDGKKVVDVVWTVHLANKKLNNYSTVSKGGQFRGMEIGRASCRERV